MAPVVFNDNVLAKREPVSRLCDSSKPTPVSNDCRILQDKKCTGKMTWLFQAFSSDQKFDMAFGSNGSPEIKFQIRFPLTAASWTESDPLHVEFDEKHIQSSCCFRARCSRIMQDH